MLAAQFPTFVLIAVLFSGVPGSKKSPASLPLPWTVSSCGIPESLIQP